MGPRTSPTPAKEVKPRSGGQPGRAGDAECHGTSPVLNNPKSVVRKQVSPQELQTPGGPYIKRTFTIVGDDVGWGFVVRGSAPCHIQAVDPSGLPQQWMRQFVVSVNGVNALSLDYRTVSHLILTGPRTFVMEVMEPLDP